MEEINKDLQPFNVEYKTNTEYAIPNLEEIINRYKEVFNINPEELPKGKGHRKCIYQKNYIKLEKY